MEPLRHDGAVDGRTDRARTAGIEKSREGVTGSNHHRIDAAGFEAFPRQTSPCHRFDHVPVLTEIARSLMLGRKFGLQTASLTRISVRDLKKHCLRSLFRVGLRPRSIAHRLFLCGRRQARLLGSISLMPSLRRYCVASHAIARVLVLEFILQSWMDAGPLGARRTGTDRTARALAPGTPQG